VQEWIRAVATKTGYNERGSPWENGSVESSLRRLRRVIESNRGPSPAGSEPSVGAKIAPSGVTEKIAKRDALSPTEAGELIMMAAVAQNRAGKLQKSAAELITSHCGGRAVRNTTMGRVLTLSSGPGRIPVELPDWVCSERLKISNLSERKVLGNIMNSLSHSGTIFNKVLRSPSL
jgi:hypothetical protein